MQDAGQLMELGDRVMSENSPDCTGKCILLPIGEIPSQHFKNSMVVMVMFGVDVSRPVHGLEACSFGMLKKGSSD